MSHIIFVTFVASFGAALSGRCCWKQWGDAATCGGYPSGSKGGLCNTDYKTKCTGSTCDAPAPPPQPTPPPPSPVPPPSPTPPPPPEAAAQVYNSSVFHVKVTHDVTYAQGLIGCTSRSTAASCKSKDLKLDVYEPTMKSGGIAVPDLKPAYVMMHGGGNVGGAKGGLNIYVAQWWASRGFVVFDINYRLSADKGLLPAQQGAELLGWAPQWLSFYPATRDAKAAIRFVRANAGKYGIDDKRVASTGGSAGATDMYAAGVSFEDDFKNEVTDSQDPTLSSTNLKFSSAVQCLVLHWPSEAGVGLLQDRYPAAGNRYRSENPPVVSFHGDKDTTIPILQSYAIQKDYAKTGVPFHLHVLNGCPHGSWCYNGEGACTCSGAQRSPLMEELAFPVVATALRLTIVDSSSPVGIIV